jgi:hypothetical protein
VAPVPVDAVLAARLSGVADFVVVRLAGVLVSVDSPQSESV